MYFFSVLGNGFSRLLRRVEGRCLDHDERTEKRDPGMGERFEDKEEKDRANRR